MKNNVLELKKKKNDFAEYLKVLSFSDLINESNELMAEMEDELTSELMYKTSLMTHEISRRLEKDSKFLSESIDYLK